MTILLNFAHPLIKSQITAVEKILNHKITEVRDIPVQFDLAEPFASQVNNLTDGIGFSAFEWQTLPVLVNPPAHAIIAVSLLANLHGRMGYFPPVIRLRPIPGEIPVSFKFAEIISLQEIRELARFTRKGEE